MCNYFLEETVLLFADQSCIIKRDCHWSYQLLLSKEADPREDFLLFLCDSLTPFTFFASPVSLFSVNALSTLKPFDCFALQMFVIIYWTYMLQERKELREGSLKGQKGPNR